MVNSFIELVEKNAKQNMIVAEVGVRYGETTIPSAKIVKKFNGIYIAIDWFFGSIAEGHYNESPYMFEQFKMALFNNDCSDVVKIINKSSEDALQEIENNYLDICFIDADHTYKYVKNDILNYTQKVKNGGILCGHDIEDHYIPLFNTFTDYELTQDCINGCHCGVIQAIGEIFGFENITLHKDSVWSIIINK